MWDLFVLNYKVAHTLKHTYASTTSQQARRLEDDASPTRKSRTYTEGRFRPPLVAEPQKIHHSFWDMKPDFLTFDNKARVLSEFDWHYWQKAYWKDMKTEQLP